MNSALRLRFIGVLLTMATPLLVAAQGGQRMQFDGGDGDLWVESGGGELTAFCIDQGIRTMEAGDQFLAASQSLTITRVVDGVSETQRLNDVLGLPGWIKITGSGRANAVFVSPTTAALGAKFAIHVPAGKPAFLSPGARIGLQWDMTRAGAEQGVWDAERVYGRHGAALQRVADFARKLRSTFGGDSYAVKLFDSDSGAGPRSKINWRLRTAKTDAGAQIVQEEIANYKLDLLARDEVDRSQATRIMALAVDGPAKPVLDSQIEAYLLAYREFRSPVLSAYFRQLVAKGMAQAGTLTEATATASATVQADPSCQAFSKKLAALSPSAARALEEKALAALEFNEDLAKALKSAGIDATAGRS